MNRQHSFILANVVNMHIKSKPAKQVNACRVEKKDIQLCFIPKGTIEVAVFNKVKIMGMT
jgi:hypothetical protein